MKKLITIIAVSCLAIAFTFAASYTNNEFQKAARKYNMMAQQAYDEGEYDQAVEYTQLAMENAEKSKAYIEMMMAKNEADKKLYLARAKQSEALKVRGDVNFPMAYSAGSKALESALAAYQNEDYKSATDYALEALEAFAPIKYITPLPQFYVVRPWAESKDCYWNISGRPYVYNNPVLWENLYQANKSKMRDPSNPDLILPGMKMEIPSIAGEYREGTYSPKNSYNSFNANR
ncbi:MAG: hypothetical protein K5839_03950 [Treponemataceae bacterium]|nr:hypothetical protein [Treponemataceae bacterium]